MLKPREKILDHSPNSISQHPRSALLTLHLPTQIGQGKDGLSHPLPFTVSSGPLGKDDSFMLGVQNLGCE